MPMGNHVVQPEPERLAKCIADGYRFIAYGIDAVFLLHGCACPKRVKNWGGEGNPLKSGLPPPQTPPLPS